MTTSNTLEIIVRARDEASKTLDAVSQKIGLTPNQMKVAGGAMLGAGTLMAAGLMAAAKAAAAEDAGVQKLSTAMRNMGLSYEDSRDSLESWIDAMQQKTSVADDQQRDALATLIGMTGDMAQAQDLLALAMDVSAGTGKDLASSTQLLGYAMSGNWGMVERMIPALKSVESEEEKWAALRQQFAGQAETYGQTVSGQMETLQNNLGDVKEALGTALLPVIADVVEWIQKLVQWLKGLDPQMVKWIAGGVAAAAALSTVGGAVLLVLGFLPQLAAGLAIVKTAFAAVNVVMMANPIGLIVLAIAAVITAIVLLVKHWDWVKEKAGAVADWVQERWAGLVEWFKGLPEKIKSIFERVGEFMMAPIKAYLGIYVKAWNWIADQLNKVSLKLPDFLGGKSFGFSLPRISQTFAQGGLIDEPTLMYGMRSGRYSLAGEAGPEYITPADRAPAGVTVNVSQLVVREEADVRRIAEELAWMIQYRTRSARGLA